MTKPHPKKHHAKTPARPPARAAGPPDGAVYIGILMIGAFGVWLWTIVVDEPDSWKHAVLGYVIAIAVLVNLYAWRVYLRKHLVPWQQSLARLVLRWAGFGTSGGRPLEAAHDSERAKAMLFVSLAASAVIIAGLGFLLYRQ